MISRIEMDCYDAIELVSGRTDHASRMLADTARRVADLWNDPPHSAWESMQVREAFPALADALDELLGGGPSTPPRSVDELTEDGEAFKVRPLDTSAGRVRDEFNG